MNDLRGLVGRWGGEWVELRLVDGGRVSGVVRTAGEDCVVVERDGEEVSVVWGDIRSVKLS